MDEKTSGVRLRVATEVAAARGAGLGVVALESTLVAQGLPWPVNLETARAAERAVRAAGALPATVAAIGGELRIGLGPEDLERLARSGTFRKAGRRDLAAALAGRHDAATTVSATLHVARTVGGIPVLATGGLGGVHRGAATSFDVSADLDELARADGALVVCSGVKAILDVPATLERLETLGVAVVGYRTGEMPGFTTLTTGLPLESRVDSPEEAAELVRTHRALGLPGAIVLVQPVPAADALDRAEFDSALAAALDDASARGVAGKAITPFLLDRIRRATEGRSLQANRSLIVANAALAGEVATILARH
jgi:pseudouridine-5'-phosphate glycosidase